MTDGSHTPEWVSVVGFDDIPESAYLSPPMTTVQQDSIEVGRCCIGVMRDQIVGAGVESGVEAPRLVVATELGVRARTAPPAHSDKGASV